MIKIVVLWSLCSVAMLAALVVHNMYWQDPRWAGWVINFALGLGIGVTATNAWLALKDRP